MLFENEQDENLRETTDQECGFLRSSLASGCRNEDLMERVLVCRVKSLRTDLVPDGCAIQQRPILHMGVSAGKDALLCQTAGQEMVMIDLHARRRWLRKVKGIGLTVAVAMALLAPAAPATADNCSTDAIGLANSGQTVVVPATNACAPAYGEPAGVDTGRKNG